MNNLYNKFRFARKDIFSGRSESIVQFVFFQVSFFLGFFKDGYFSFGELSRSVDMAAESAGILIPDKALLVNQVMDFFCGEYGYDRSLGHHFDAVRDIIREICMIHMINGVKFIEPLAGMIIDEFNYGENYTTVGDIIHKLKNTPRFMFLSNDLLEQVVYAVYDYFTGDDDTES